MGTPDINSCGWKHKPSRRSDFIENELDIMDCMLHLCFFALLVIGDNCDFGSNSDNNVCANTTNIDNPQQSQSTEVEGNRIALGVGIGIGVPTLLSSNVAICLTVRHWKRKERMKKEAQST